jgi:hypothetical protein
VDDHVAARPDRDGVIHPKALLDSDRDSRRDRFCDDRRIHGTR